jgi:hypothetical protein
MDTSFIIFSYRFAAYFAIFFERIGWRDFRATLPSGGGLTGCFAVDVTSALFEGGQIVRDLAMGKSAFRWKTGGHCVTVEVKSDDWPRMWLWSPLPLSVMAIRRQRSGEREGNDDAQSVRIRVGRSRTCRPGAERDEYALVFPGISRGRRSAVPG